jgi:signal transduction histidine kinase
VPVPQAHDEIQYLALTLNEMLDSLDRSFSHQRRFLADASHELRTPVAVIRNKAGIALLETPTLPDTIDALQEINGETERLSQLISDLLTLSRADQGQVLFDRETVQLDVMVAMVVEMLDVLANEHGIQLEAQVRKPVTLVGDEARLIQVVINLLDNAIRHTHPGGRICVTVEKPQSAALLVVSDSGIAEEHLSHIFERFYRADPSRRRTGGGSSGLGLAIVEWIVRAPGGSIAVTSEVGRGSYYTITLPLSQPSP